MKNNILLLCLDETYGRKIGEELSNEIDMFFLDIKDLLEYNLVNNKLREMAGEAYYNQERQKVIDSVVQYENSCVLCNLDLLKIDNNMAKYKRTSLCIYLKESNDDKTMTEFQPNGRDTKDVFFISNDKFCQRFADIIVPVEKKTNKDIKAIKQKIAKFYKI